MHLDIFGKGHSWFEEAFLSFLFDIFMIRGVKFNEIICD